MSNNCKEYYFEKGMINRNTDILNKFTSEIKNSVADPDADQHESALWKTPISGSARTRSVADPDPWNAYHFPGSGSV